MSKFIKLTLKFVSFLCITIFLVFFNYSLLTIDLIMIITTTHQKSSLTQSHFHGT